MDKFLKIFGLFGFLAVALGAFEAHSLRDRLDPASLDVFRTAPTYQFYHTLALGIVILLNRDGASVWLKRAAFFFVLGTVIFSGSLYALALTQIKILGAITPIGGMLLLAGWMSVARSSFAKNDSVVSDK